jgi:hypothetical protein
MNPVAKFSSAAVMLTMAGSVSMLSVTPAAALFDICKDVKITAVNNTGGTIKIFDFDYWDFGSNRKRSENISNVTIENGRSYTIRRNLEGVNNAKTFVRVQFRKLKSNGKWDNSSWWNADSGTKTCRKGSSYRITFR